jgi:hypothetical protein
LMGRKIHGSSSGLSCQGKSWAPAPAPSRPCHSLAFFSPSKPQQG